MSIVAIQQGGRPDTPQISARRGAISSDGGVGDMLAAHRRLDSSRSITELLSRASAVAREVCGFSRALVVFVDDQVLRTDGLGALRDPASDVMRRRLLAQPVRLRPRTLEAELIRCAEGARGQSSHSPSVLGSALELDEFVVAPVIPDDRVLALLVLDRSGPSIEATDVNAAHLFAHLLGCSVGRLVAHQRMREFGAELRHLTASAEALVKEALESPISLPRDYGAGPVFALECSGPPAGERLHELFTPRELNIAEQMIHGRSNREIAAELQISPETVKTYVARVIRKLGASNRADAAVRYLRMSSTPSSLGLVAS
jgi:LuxR family transcriptional regulator, regulator of acetate metabolism